jgi:hypothetical protein
MAGGWIWFGNAGVALMTLWCAARPPWQQEAFLLTGIPSQFTVIEPWRIAFRNHGLRGGLRGRVGKGARQEIRKEMRKEMQREVFRDEVSAADWTRLRRQALAASTQRRP